MKSVKAFVLLCGSIGLSAVLAFGQMAPNTENGIKSFGSYQGTDIDTVNLQSGNVAFHIPLFSYPQRGKLPLRYWVQGNSKNWQVGEYFDKQRNSHERWMLSSPGDLYFTSDYDVQLQRVRTISTDVNGNQIENDFDYGVHTPDGSIHWLVGSGANGSMLAVDGSGFQLMLTHGTAPNHSDDFAVLTDGKGTTYRYNRIWWPVGTTAPIWGTNANIISHVNFVNTKVMDPANTVQTFHDRGLPGNIVDSNGNTQVIYTVSSDGLTLTEPSFDVFGRELPFVLADYGAVATSDFSGCASAMTMNSANIFNFPGPDGKLSPVKACYGNFTPSPTFSQANVEPPSNDLSFKSYPEGLLPLLVSLATPDGNHWSFTYDNYENLTSITLPTGGTISYSWEEVSLPTCEDGNGTLVSRAVATRTVNDLVKPPQTWQYTWGTMQQDGTITNYVRDPNGNETAHVFHSPVTGQPCALYETETRTYQGSHLTGKLLKTVDTHYTADYSNTQDLNFPGNVFADTITTTLPGNKVSQTVRQHDPGPAGSFGVSTLSQVTDEKVYDYGSALLRETVTTYEWQVNPAYFNAGLIDLPASVVVKDGSGCSMAETDYTYDESSYLTTYPGTLPAGTHGTAPGGTVRGNLTTVTKWAAPTSSCNPKSGTAIISHTNWYDTGEVYQQIDPLGHTTTYSYDPVYAGAFVTQTCSPSTGGGSVSHCVSGTYDSISGLVESLTNENATTQAIGNTPGDSAHTSNYIYDTSWRLIQALAPPDLANNSARATTTFTPSAPNVFPLSVQHQHSVTTGPPDSSTAYFDGVGRVNETTHALPNGTATVLTTYDGLGQMTSVTNPYFTTSDATYGVTYPFYDSLGRVTQTTRQDGSISSVSYDLTSSAGLPADCTTAIDEASKQRKSCSDALGRLVEVDEPNPSAPATSAQDTLTINGSLQSHTSSGTAAVAASGSVSIWSGDGSGADMRVNDPNEPCPPPPRTCPQIYDSGWVQVTINGIAANVNYGRFDTWTSVATNLASAINSSGANVHVTASPNGTSISLQAKTAGAAGNSITLSVISATNDPGDFGGGSFGGNPSGATLSSGADAVNPVTTYDQGTVTLTIGSFIASAPYSQSGNSTAAQIATVLAGAGSTGLNRAGSPVSAMASGANITITYGTAGTAGNGVAIAGSSQSTQTQWAFSPPSFSSAGTSLANGLNVGDVNNNPLVTLYQYDGLGNLLCVEQHGGVTGTGCSSSPTNDASSPWRVRRFAYDSAGRLLTAKNPESGTISYTYDNDGNLLQKTSPAPNQTGSATQTITYCYDELHRVTGRGYGAQSCPLTSPVVGYTYDSGVNGKGHLISLIDQAGTATSTYDVLGRVVTETRSIAGASKSIGYTYNLDSSIKTLTYPSGRVVTYTPDSAGRLVSAVDGNGTNYVISASYNPDGSLKGFLNGSTPALNSSVQYNPRLQLCRITALTSGTAPTSCTDSQHIGNVMDRGYDFHAGNGAPGSGTDNGNVMAITNYRDTSRSQGFTYDPLNRLTAGWSMANTGNYSWGENYSIDAWGNLQITPMQGKAHGGNFTLSSTVQNRPTGLSYDAAGNMRSYLFATYTYDSENRLASTSGMSYTYDGNGERVLKSQTVGGIAVKSYWSMGGKTLAESDGSGNLTAEYVYFASKRIARIDLPANIVHYYLSDHINSISTVVSAAGVIEEESDYSSFGTEYPISETGNNRYKFTGKERDTETGLDNFGARYFGNAFGRFLSPDPDQVSGFENKEDPQSWSGYAYARNNPLKYVDSDGDSYHVCDEHGQNCNNIDDEAADRAQKAGDIWKDGKIYLRGDDGSLQFKGTYQDQGRDIPGDPAQNIAAAGMIVATTNAAMKEFGKNAAYAATGTVVLRGVGLGIEALQAARAAKTAAQIEGETVVIGKLADLENLGEGERTLTLPNQGNPQANWVQNSSRLRQAMSSGEPIRDASVGNPAGNTGFLRAERYLLQDHGWTLKGEYWYPPEK